MKKRLKIDLIAAARPNFMKIAPLYHALKREVWAQTRIIHTGQHYDKNMSQTFFDDFELPTPDIYLGIGSGSHAEQTASVMVEYEKVLRSQKRDLIVVVGDVNSTMAAAITASKLGITTAHLEAGLRSFDRTMPEEINRRVTDVLVDFLWTPSPDADENLLREGVEKQKITRVGNIMIDTLKMMKKKIQGDSTLETLGLCEREYAIVTLHRPSNVDEKGKLSRIWEILENMSVEIPIVFPIHPRTQKQLNLFGINTDAPQIKKISPLSYLSFMNLVCNARVIITDSGGVQEETTYLGIPCLTLRDNTERPITITQGTNRLCNVENLEDTIEGVLKGHARRKPAPERWDGKTAKRVVADIKKRMLV